VTALHVRFVTARPTASPPNASGRFSERKRAPIRDGKRWQRGLAGTSLHTRDESHTETTRLEQRHRLQRLRKAAGRACFGSCRFGEQRGGLERVSDLRWRARKARTISQILVSRDGWAVELSAQAVFVFIGADANTDWLAGAIDLDNDGFVLTGEAPGATTRRGWPQCIIDRSKRKQVRRNREQNVQLAGCAKPA
jgi:hypothetical protein